jgi:5-methylcytosine-specific restriction protein A
MTRREFPDKVKVAAFQRADGRCEKCTAKLFVGKIHYDHRIPDAMGGEPTLSNCDVLCSACHGEKTTRIDVPAIAKVKRIRAKHLGAAKPSTWRKPPEGYDPWKRRMREAR